MASHWRCGGGGCAGFSLVPAISSSRFGWSFSYISMVLIPHPLDDDDVANFGVILFSNMNHPFPAILSLTIPFGFSNFAFWAPFAFGWSFSYISMVLFLHPLDDDQLQFYAAPLAKANQPIRLFLFPPSPRPLW
jgi:hypothetical protein